MTRNLENRIGFAGKGVEPKMLLAGQKPLTYQTAQKNKANANTKKGERKMKKTIITRMMNSIIRKAERIIVNKDSGDTYYIFGRFTAYKEGQKCGVLFWDNARHDNVVKNFATLFENGRVIVG